MAIQKLGARNMIHAVRIGIESGIIHVNIEEGHEPDRFLLTETELSILELASQGITTKEIAMERFNARETIKGHRKAILLKLGAHSMAHAVRRGFEMGVLTPRRGYDPFSVVLRRTKGRTLHHR